MTLSHKPSSEETRYTLRLSSFGGVDLRDSPSVTYKNTLIGLTTRSPTRILEILWVYYFLSVASFEEEKTKSFCQTLQALWGKQYVYKIHPKTHAIKKVSAEIKSDQSLADKSVADRRSPSDSSSLLGERACADNAREKGGEKANKEGRIKFFKDSVGYFLSIHFCLLVIFSSFSSIQACSGRFVNHITDICWSCLFPISIGAVTMSGFGGREDTPNAPQIPCFCPRAAYSFSCSWSPRWVLGAGAPCGCDAGSFLYGEYGGNQDWKQFR